MKVLLKDKSSFSPKLIKAFLERVGLYPRGTFVELNTREVAQVIRQNPKMLACPMVRVVYDPEGKKTQNPREIDLSRGTKIYILRNL